MGEYCHHSSGCEFYKIWKEQTKDERIDIIRVAVTIRKKGSLEDFRYDCRALIDLNDPIAGIPMREKLKNRLINPMQQTLKCAHITSLNLLTEISNKLEKSLAELNKE